MKRINKIFLVFVLAVLVMLAYPYNVGAAPLAEDRTVIGESYTLKSGNILKGNLNVIGGVVEIEQKATVDGNMFVLGGLVTIDGTIKGNLTAVGGTVNLNQTALVEGDLISPVSFINLDPDAEIVGDQIHDWIIPDFGLEQFTNVRPPFFRTNTFTIVPILTRIGKALATSLVMVALGAFLLLIMPKSADRMTQALVSAPWHLLGFGALSALVMLFVVIGLAITFCLIPVAILVGLTFALAVLVGWLALGYELGKRIASSLFKTTWHPVLSAAIGNLLLYLVAKGVNLIPCIGWFLIFITMLFGLGMVVVTLFGTYPYPRTGVHQLDNEPEVLFEKQLPAKIDLQPKDESLMPEVAPEEPIEQVEVKTEVLIEDLALSTRVNNLLKESGLESVSDVLNRLEEGDEALLEIEGFGEKSLRDLKEALRNLGYFVQ